MLPQAILSLMLAAGPQPGRSIYSVVVVPHTSEPACAEPSLLCAPPKWSEDWQGFTRPETRDEGMRRYWVIAQAIAQAAPKSKRLRSLLLAVTMHESGWRRDVHSGIGPATQGDQGRSWGMGQALLGVGSEQGKALVGVSQEATNRCIDHTANNLQRASRYCVRQAGSAGVRCIFGIYGGLSADTKHKGVLKRVNSFHRFSAKPAPLAAEVTELLGLDDVG